MEPIFFEPVYKSVIWGGNKIAKEFNRKLEKDDIGESWELSAHPNGLSKINNTNKNLLELFEDKSIRQNIFGTKSVNLEKFPILIKFIDANKNLSIQVHPDDKYAKKYENDSGKNEVWYVMECSDKAKIVYGFKNDVTSNNLKATLDNTIENHVKYINVHQGDFISIPAGTIHAIGEKILLCEVQKTSDITYRVYDWNRTDANGKGRELHKEKALDVINLNLKNDIHNYKDVSEQTTIYESKEFSIDMINIKEELEENSCKDSFFAYVVLEGKGKINSNGFSKAIEKGSVFLIPASLGKYQLSGKMKVMKVYM